MSKSSLTFKHYIVERVSFEINLEYSGRDLDVEMDLDTSNEIDGDNFATILDLDLFPEAVKNDFPFNMKVRLIGLFTIQNDEKEEIKESYIEKNSVSILFPYLRSIVSTYTANSNVNTTILPTINVIKYLEKKRRKDAEV
ncbi:protein-export chaperone SecB [Clostridium paraputrificum]|mgnify:CR=1 FL=1|uniref:protein-export chaperone SecB n=1 Tax=Clostridium paraputrificum TaxID=29363 RepID=UPI002330ADD5|nr:protein-export chaperone SecB [Clostridium paraputrificum]MDB2076560.1 protein-export chaperone SecB [Clostridium paraputrificum]MDB2080059.1 protein-export chaperone SecB [Clostridium paraputrificum]